MHILLVFGAALMFTVGGIFMKLSDGLSRLWPTLALLLVFGIGAALQALAMKGAELGVTYIVVLGVEAILACGFGIWLFQESVTAVKLGGVALIVLGILSLRSAG